MVSHLSMQPPPGSDAHIKLNSQHLLCEAAPCTICACPAQRELEPLEHAAKSQPHTDPLRLRHPAWKNITTPRKPSVEKQPPPRPPARAAPVLRPGTLQAHPSLRPEPGVWLVRVWPQARRGQSCRAEQGPREQGKRKCRSLSCRDLKDTQG